MVHLCRRAFFNGRPASLFPEADGLFVPLQGASSGLLATPAHLAQQAADLGGRIPMAKALVNQCDHTRQRPECGDVAQGLLRSALQVGGQLDALQHLEARFATGASRMFECLASPALPSQMPAPCRLVAYAAAPGDIGFGEALFKELHQQDTE